MGHAETRFHHGLKAKTSMSWCKHSSIFCSFVKGRYVKFRMRSNSVTCVDNSPMIAKCDKPICLGIAYFSIMGHEDSRPTLPCTKVD